MLRSLTMASNVVKGLAFVGCVPAVMQKLLDITRITQAVAGPIFQREEEGWVGMCGAKLARRRLKILNA